MENGKGASARIKNNLGFGSTEFYVFRSTEFTNSEWIYTFLSLPSLRKNAENKMTGAVGQQRVPSYFFEELRIGLPPIELQNKFADIVHQVGKLKAKYKKSEKDLDNLFGSIKQWSSRGNL